MVISIRGRTIRVQGNEGMRYHYVRLYSSFTDDKLDELEREGIAEDKARELRYASAKDIVKLTDLYDEDMIDEIVASHKGKTNG